MERQLTLNIRLQDHCSFANYLSIANSEPVEYLLGFIDTVVEGTHPKTDLLFLWGQAGTGKTHLLQAACRETQERGLRPVYVPLQEADHLQTALLQGLEHSDLVCIDDVDAIAGKGEWEQALFNLYETTRGQTPLVIAGSANPKGLGLHLFDLATRLGAGLVYQLRPLSDGQKLEVLQRRARSRGMELSGDVARYVLHHYPRDMQALFALLDQLDQASLTAQRRITIPFIQNLEGRTED